MHFRTLWLQHNFTTWKIWFFFNHCRECTSCKTGEYMFSGKCADETGGATDPLQRVCRACRNCSVGEYKTSLCSGKDFYQAYSCEACSTCPEGLYVSRQCEGSRTNVLGRTCTQCRLCPKGFYRVRCSDGPGTGKTHTSLLYTSSKRLVCSLSVYPLPPCSVTLFQLLLNELLFFQAPNIPDLPLYHMPS